jgi:hypothetical protein
MCWALNLVLKSIKEPVYFRGDGSEKCTVHEWQDMVMVYMHKRGVSVVDQADEVMRRLMRRACNVVKVGIRSNPSVDSYKRPKSHLGPLLKQHFSDTSISSMPFADFYATLPLTNEPFDYWLRLNRAMEVAEDCLKNTRKVLKTHLVSSQSCSSDIALTLNCRLSLSAGHYCHVLSCYVLFLVFLFTSFPPAGRIRLPSLPFLPPAVPHLL